jgi:hypothetical protein
MLIPHTEFICVLLFDSLTFSMDWLRLLSRDAHA